MKLFSNHIAPNPDAVVLFIDMNSFFASCEQQENKDWRGKVLVVCGNPNNNGVIVAPSIEAKQKGIKTGMRINEARQLYKDVIAVSPHSDIYRKYHKAIMHVLRSYAEDVIPKSIDEAAVNLTPYRFMYPDPEKLAAQIKKDICEKVGDWLKCSIGIAPNTFLAKLATDLQKPDGLVRITAQNIDDILKRLDLIDLPGIGEQMKKRLLKGGIRSPFEMRHAHPMALKKIMGGIVGYHWHYRLNFSEIDFHTGDYKGMSAERTLSKEQRKDPIQIDEIFTSLCMRLESRMVKHHVFTKQIGISIVYGDKSHVKLHVNSVASLQDGTEIKQILEKKITEHESSYKHCKVINDDIRKLGVWVGHFVNDKQVQYEIFDNRLKKDTVRKTVYELKEKYGAAKLIKAVELKDEPLVKDVIGFGSVKDMYDKGQH